MREKGGPEWAVVGVTNELQQGLPLRDLGGWLRSGHVTTVCVQDAVATILVLTTFSFSIFPAPGVSGLVHALA